MRDQTRMLVLAALFAVVTAVANFIKIPVGVVPITLLFFATALSGVLLGPKWGAVSQVVYVVLGLVGLPIFTGGGGLGYVFQPSFGFLLGLIPAAWVIGMLTRGEAGPVRVALAALAGLGVLYLVGLPYMWLILNVYLDKAMALPALLWSGMLIFLPGDFLKIAGVAALSRPLGRALARRGGAYPATLSHIVGVSTGKGGKRMQYEDRRPRQEAADHHVILEGRASLSVSGVEEVESFDENAIVMRTAQGTLVVRGEELHIEKLSLDGGDLRVEGMVDSLTYEDDGGVRGGFLARLFR